MKKKPIVRWNLTLFLVILVFSILSPQILLAFQNQPIKELEITKRAWTLTEVVSTETTDDSFAPSLAVDSSLNVHVAWHEQTDYAGSGTDEDIFYKFWNATSESWATTAVVSTESTRNSYEPSLAVDSARNVHVAWMDLSDYLGAGTEGDIFYKFWNATSESWTTTTVVSTESTDTSIYPSLAVDTLGNVHVAWYDSTDYAGSGGDTDIFYKFWNATSESWNATTVVSTESTGSSIFPSLDVDSAGNIHVAWFDRTDYAGADGDSDIFYKFWNATSESWNATEVVSTESTDDSSYPSLAVDSAGNVHVAWNDWTDYAGAGIDRDNFYKFWNATDGSWNTTVVISTESTDHSFGPSLAVDSAGDIHVAWYDRTDYAGSGTHEDIFYKFWNATSESWNTTAVVSTESVADSHDPSLAVDSAGDIHVAWRDLTDYAGAGGDWDIFYKRFGEIIPVIPEFSLIPLILILGMIIGITLFISILRRKIVY